MSRSPNPGEQITLSNQINHDSDCPQVDHISSAFKTDNLIYSFRPMVGFNRPETTVKAYSNKYEGPGQKSG
jgi:hypothetical protein